ncbi:MAG TPA: DUF4143 domain-containing protein [Acidimicrobiales bacterium]|nr:DUF4143 domain-containing protein [Acidimicrobiales bacterium]
MGPRAVGKTTTARRLAGSFVRLDRPAEAGVVRADPDAALADRPEPVVIDEWPLVPEVLGAVKRAVDDDPRPGRFVLTGSAGADLGAAGWPATGRVVRVPLWGLTVRELIGDPATAGFLDRMAAVDGEPVQLPAEVPDIRGYVEHALRGGFPEAALQEQPRLRRLWLDSWVDQVVARDVPLAGAGRDPVRLRRYLQAIAANSAGVVQHRTLYEAAGINRLTALAYDTVMETLFVTDRIPAWTSNRLVRLSRTAKRYLVDPALVGPLLGMDPRAVLRDIDVLGRLLDGFVVAQLRAELAVSAESPRLFHLRQENGRHEVDLLAERADGTVIAMEVKATASPSVRDAAHLVWLRDQLGDRFLRGIVLHTGPRPLRLAERVLALPICALWS